MDEEKRMKMAIIAGASHALKFKQKNARVSDEETIQHVSNEVDAILRKIDEEE